MPPVKSGTILDPIPPYSQPSPGAFIILIILLALAILVVLIYCFLRIRNVTQSIQRHIDDSCDRGNKKHTAIMLEKLPSKSKPAPIPPSGGSAKQPIQPQPTKPSSDSVAGEGSVSGDDNGSKRGSHKAPDSQAGTAEVQQSRKQQNESHHPSAQSGAFTLQHQPATGLPPKQVISRISMPRPEDNLQQEPNQVPCSESKQSIPNMTLWTRNNEDESPAV